MQQGAALMPLYHEILQQTQVYYKGGRFGRTSAEEHEHEGGFGQHRFVRGEHVHGGRAQPELDVCVGTRLQIDRFISIKT